MNGGPNGILGNQLRIRLAKSDSESGTQNRNSVTFKIYRIREHNLLGKTSHKIPSHHKHHLSKAEALSMIKGY